MNKKALVLGFIVAAVAIAASAMYFNSREAGYEENLKDRLKEFADLAQKGGDRSPPPVSLSSRIQMIQDKAYIEFTMTNITDKPIQTIELFLPWDRMPITLLAAFTPSGRSLRLGVAPDNPPVFTEVRIEPGQSLRGSYQISRNAWEIDSVFDEDVILLWRYMFSESSGYQEGVKHPPYQPIVGVTVVPKNRLKQASKP